MSRAHIVLLPHSRLGWYTPMATAGFVCQPFQTLLQKPLHPLVNKATADPDRDSNFGDRHPIGNEQDNPAASGPSCRNGGGPLPRHERLTFRRCKTDRERGFT